MDCEIQWAPARLLPFGLSGWYILDMKTLSFIPLCACFLPGWFSTGGVDWSHHFSGVDGTFVLLDGNSGRYTRFNEARAGQRFPPCSTFKIPNSAIALETGAAPDADFTLHYDPAFRLKGDWARDHTLRTAFRFSVVWYYQEMARRVGPATMARFVRQFGYGNEDTSGEVDRFWLGKPLGISADEQVRFLKRFYEGQLGLSERTTRLVKEIMLTEEGPDWRLSGKTGACGEEGQDVALWYVGYVEKQGQVFFFALEMGGRDYEPLFGQRIPKTKAILKDLGILPRS